MNTYQDGDSRKTTPVLSRVVGMLADVDVAELCPLGLLLSKGRRVAWCNERFAYLFGYSRATLLEADLSVLYPSDAEFERIGSRGLREMLVSGDYQDERLMRRRDDVLQWFRVHGRTSDRGRPFDEAVWTFEPLSVVVDAERLTPREREVLAAVAHGMTAKECGKELGISPRTVEKIRDGLRAKYGVRNAAELMSRVSGLP